MKKVAFEERTAYSTNDFNYLFKRAKVKGQSIILIPIIHKNKFQLESRQICKRNENAREYVYNIG